VAEYLQKGKVVLFGGVKFTSLFEEAPPHPTPFLVPSLMTSKDDKTFQ
jgi:hypothetical protein